MDIVSLHIIIIRDSYLSSSLTVDGFPKFRTKIDIVRSLESRHYHVYNIHYQITIPGEITWNFIALFLAMMFTS